ncbi:MAG: SPOR domain-containing protein [Caulobacteraceae bacterium]
MSDHDRGAYTPQPDAPLAFDARSPRARRPLPFALIASAVVLVVLVGSVALYYLGGTKSGDAGKEAGQPVAAVKTAPPAGEQPKDPAAQLDVYAAQNVPANAPPSAPTFAPAPEQPQPRPAPGLKVQTVEPAKIHLPAAPPPAVTPPPAATSIAPPAALAAAAQPKPAVVKPVEKPVELKLAEAKPATPAAVPAASGGSALVQIGAFSSNVLADKGWKEIATAFPAQMSGKSKRVEPLEKAGATLYRTSITGFADKAAAQAFCAQLKAAGRACFVKG